MAGELHIGNDQFQYIARISHGKDSLKMLDVIVSRGLRLDRITTTDIWATDTIRGEHPKASTSYGSFGKNTQNYGLSCSRGTGIALGALSSRAEGGRSYRAGLRKAFPT